MKNIIITLLFILLNSNNITAQTLTIVDYSNHQTDDLMGETNIIKYYKDLNNNFAPFIGKWIWQNGNQTFEVILWKATKHPFGNPIKFYSDEIFGHYRLVENYGLMNEQEIYTSDKYFKNNIQLIPHSIFVGSTNGINAGGTVHEFSVPDNAENYAIFGDLSLTKINANTMQWKVRPIEEAMSIYRVFNIPTDIVLTKVN